MPAIPVKKQNRNSRFLFFDELPSFARRFSKTLVPGDVVSLTGPIGAGKTTFVYTLMKVLGLPQDAPFSSPTFTILNQYQLKEFTVNHMDLYRLNRFEELENLDILDYCETPGALTFVEWGDKFSELKALYSKRIHFEHVKDSSLARFISFDGFMI